MPRKKLVRRFEPRYGVSREMLDVEGKYIAREHEDYLLLGTTELKQKLEELRGKWREADQTLETLIRSLRERDSIAFQCLLARDLYLILELYCSCLQTARDAFGAQAPLIPAATPPPRPAEKAVPFSEWLFGPTG